MEIIRGTTPTLVFTFKTISPEDIGVAYLLIRQCEQVVIEKHVEDATIADGKMSFTLTQTDTLALEVEHPATVVLDWKTTGGIRGRSDIYYCAILPAGKPEVI